MDNQALFHMSLKNSYREWQAFLDKWCGGRTFTREMLFDGTRKVTNSTNHLMKQLLFFTDYYQNLNRHREIPNVWLSVYNYKYRTDELSNTKTPGERSKPLYSSAIIDKMLFDFDVKVAGDVPTIAELRPAFEEAVYLQDEGATMLLSGRKGFQVHKAVETPFKSSIDLKEAQMKIHDVLGFKTSDTIVYGDLSRVCRLPHSIHQQSGLCCVIVRPGETLESVYERAKIMEVPK